MLSLVFMIALPIALSSRFRNAGLKGAAPYNIGIIASVIIGYSLFIVSFGITVAFEESNSDFLPALFILSFFLLIAGFVIAFIIYRAGIKKVEKNMPVFQAPGYIPMPGTMGQAGYSAQPYNGYGYPSAPPYAPGQPQYYGQPQGQPYAPQQAPYANAQQPYTNPQQPYAAGQPAPPPPAYQPYGAYTAQPAAAPAQQAAPTVPQPQQPKTETDPWNIPDNTI